jgi:Eukaryotic aspartyl protease
MIYALILPFTSASLHKIELPPNDNIPKLNLGEILHTISPAKAKSTLTGGHDSCFLIKLKAQSQEFVVRVDTGSSDTALPRERLNNYVGPAIVYNNPFEQVQANGRYGDGSFWFGYQTRLEVGVDETDIVATCPITVMVTQSTDPVFSSGSFGDRPDGTNGLLGVGFPSLAKEKVEPRTVLDAMYKQGKIQNNAISMLGCPYGPLHKNSWMDIGNRTYLT